MSTRRRPTIAPEHPGLSVEAVLAGLATAVAVLGLVTIGVRARRAARRPAANQITDDRLADMRRAERAALAHDLHDDIAPMLFGIEADAALLRHDLARGMTRDAADRARAIEDRVRHLQTHIKKALARLVPEPLDSHGLVGALDRLVADWRRRAPGCNVTLHVAAGPPLRPPLNEVAFRVVQESLSNAMRHGAPTSIDVSIESTAGHVRLVVTDDGIGFADGAPIPGLGLTGMRARVTAAGGRLTIGNREGHRGASVEALLPLAGVPDSVPRRVDVAA